MRSSKLASQTTTVRPGFIAFGVAILIVALLYLRVLLNGLVWDDTMLVAQFGKMRQGGSLWDLLTSPFWNNSAYISTKLTDFWRPLTTGLLWLSGNILPQSAASYHLVSILSAVMASWVLYRIFLQILPTDQLFVAKWLALIFACHPLIAEIISMAANAADHLTFALVGLSVLLYLRIFEGRRSRFDYVLLFTCSFLACCAKELGLIVVAAAPMAAALRGAQGNNNPWPPLKSPIAWIPSVAGVLCYLGLRSLVISPSGAVAQQLPSVESYLTCLFFGFGQNLFNTVLPEPIGAHIYVDSSRLGPYLVSGIAWGLIAAFAALVIRGRHAFKWPLLGFVITLGLLAPSLLAAAQYVVALRLPARYFHVPMCGLLIAATPLMGRLPSRFVTVSGFVLVLMLSSLSWIRVNEWKDDYTFAVAEARHNPDQVLELVNVTQTYLNLAQFEEAEAAIAALEKLPASTVPSIRAHILGYRANVTEMRDANYDHASALLEQALNADPSNLSFVFDLARVRDRAGYPQQSVFILKKSLAAPWFQDHRKSAIETEISKYQKKAERSSR